KNGDTRRWQWAQEGQSRSWLTSKMCWGWIPCSSASRSTTIASIRRTRSLTSSASTKASGAGRAFSMRWRASRGDTGPNSYHELLFELVASPEHPPHGHKAGSKKEQCHADADGMAHIGNFEKAP